MLFHPSSRLHIGWRRESERRREEKYGWLRVDQAATVVYKRLIFLCTKIDSSSMSYCERDFASSSLSELSSCWRWHVLDFHSSSPPLAAIIDERLETETTAIKTRERWSQSSRFIDAVFIRMITSIYAIVREVDLIHREFNFLSHKALSPVYFFFLLMSPNLYVCSFQIARRDVTRSSCCTTS